jgi:Crinkler effector protein N-terminal domain
MSTSMVTVNCLEYGDGLDFSRMFSVKIDYGETIGELRTKIWDLNTSWRKYNSTHIKLYIPKTPISMVSRAEFDKVFESLNLGMPDGRDSALEELNPIFDVEDYPSLKEAAKKQLHVIVFLPAGRWR